MAAGWSVMDALNKNSKAAAEDKPKARFRTRDISIKKMYSKPTVHNAIIICFLHFQHCGSEAGDLIFLFVQKQIHVRPH